MQKKIVEFKRLQIPDIIMCESSHINDKRGYFTELHRKDLLDEFLGYSPNFCQINKSQSFFGVLRGLHYQLPPYAQTKLIRVDKGAILDVVVDLRKDSVYFGNHLAVELSENDKKQLLIPKGFAHGFIVLSSEASVTYMLDEYYNPEFERGIAFNDQNLAIDWRLNIHEIIVSEKDVKLPLLKDAELFMSSKNLYE